MGGRAAARFSVGLSLCALSLTCSLGQVVPAQGPVAGARTFTARSHSGQFLIQAPHIPGSAKAALDLQVDTNLVALEPMLLPVSCERIKQNLWRELGMGAGAPWQGKIHLALYPVRTATDPISITSERFRDGWQYWVEMPNVVERTRYLRAMVQVLLLEVANRHAEARAAELPIWLTEGLTQQLLTSRELEIILPPPRVAHNGIGFTSTLVAGRKDHPLEQAHKELSARGLLTFQQLSWPAPEQLEGEAGEFYRSSAQVFVNELLGLKEGRACLRTMLEELPQHYNWQVAFLRAFQSSFQGLLEVEKWWTLNLVHFTGRDLAQTWPKEESWEKLEEVIRSPVQVRSSTNEMPLRAEVSLQTILRDWERPQQTQALQNKLRELEMLHQRVAEDYAPVVADYHQTLQNFLLNRDKISLVQRFRKKAAQRHFLEETLQQLNALDTRRASLRPVTKPGATIQAQVTP
ncbi:MAG TPA: hypothetical protein VNT26_19150 [Candidatus Sulfotelmatobacter sp.]|nr:hypothetical protein [Candidatus Sulfotelmatobacter sp.]